MEKVIKRAAQMLSFGLTEGQVIEQLVRVGVKGEDAYLAVKAGKIFLEDCA
jgi:hypothetical protein